MPWGELNAQKLKSLQTKNTGDAILAYLLQKNHAQTSFPDCYFTFPPSRPSSPPWAGAAALNSRTAAFERSLANCQSLLCGRQIQL